eukprot:364537-Chlamydomonas_euryale.AAC.6
MQCGGNGVVMGTLTGPLTAPASGGAIAWAGAHLGERPCDLQQLLRGTVKSGRREHSAPGISWDEAVPGVPGACARQRALECRALRSVHSRYVRERRT